MQNKSPENRPFEERVTVFKTALQAIALGVDSRDAELDLNQYGRLVVEYHQLTNDEDREKFKIEKMAPMYDKLGETAKTNPKVGEAVVNIIFAESILD